MPSDARPQALTYADVNRDVVRSLVETGLEVLHHPGVLGHRHAGLLLLPLVLYQLYYGIGAAGVNHPSVWGTYLASFIFWIGLSHSGTLLSCVLHITNSEWRKAMYRSAEAMTLFSLMVAAMMVLVHVGRPWFIHWALPYPNQMEMWPNFRSPLMFDVMAITTYLTGSSIFIYMGSIPGFRRGQGPDHGLAPSHVRPAVAGLARHGPGMAPAALGLHVPGGIDHPAGGLGAQHRVLGLRALHRAGATPDHLCAVLRRRRHLFGHSRDRDSDVLFKKVHEL